MATIGVVFAHKAKESGPGGENMIESGNQGNVPFEALNQRMYMKEFAGCLGLAWLHVIVASSSMSPWDTRQWQPAAVSDFKSVAGKWEGLLASNDPMVRNYDRARLVIDDTGACE